MTFANHEELGITRPGIGILNQDGELVLFIAADGEVIARQITAGPDALDALRAPAVTKD